MSIQLIGMYIGQYLTKLSMSELQAMLTDHSLADKMSALAAQNRVTIKGLFSSFSLTTEPMDAYNIILEMARWLSAEQWKFVVANYKDLEDKMVEVLKAVKLAVQ